MRRLVRDYIAAASNRARPKLERFIAANLECPETIPRAFIDPFASITEIRSIKMAARFPADYCAVDVVVAVRAAIKARTRHRGVDRGIRTVTVDVE
jgi:hypothetical protein